jgi:tetratricopeptide (TPR) repeat protein
MAAFAAAEAKLTNALSSVPDNAYGHMWLGPVETFTKRAAQGIAECEHALALDRNLAGAHVLIGLGKVFVGRAEETETHVLEAFRLSPRDTVACTWMGSAGSAKLHLGSYEQAVTWLRQAIEANRNYPQGHFLLAAALAQLVDLTRPIPPSRLVSPSTRSTTFLAPAPPERRSATTQRT